MRTARHLLLSSSPCLAAIAIVVGTAASARADEPSAPVAVAINAPGDRAASSASSAPSDLAAAADDATEPVEDPHLLDVRAAAAEVSLRMGALRTCYERELRHQSTLAGTIVLRISVGKSGTVKRAGVARDEIKSRALGRCLVSRLQGARFAPPLAGAFELAYPLRFRPR